MYSLALAGMAVAIIALEYVALRRINTVSLQPATVPIKETVALAAGETPAAMVPAVMRHGKVRSVVSLGTDKVLAPENALLVTDNTIWALTMPLTRADKVVGGTDIG
ncbi:MAG: hypothetical protein ACOX8W_02685 [bacterium]|jgi:hypothetical protein